eukprot:TRINITY_DN5826_c0_g1_i1.p1 TRINITY_DN5826_c0_g1~~TRINITY_DN5826_c0_g1_i1.p1  ORF type:complete len:262 (+),score=10.84 TRINITY_DN5826_c0_g1_i1:42-827(+)
MAQPDAPEVFANNHSNVTFGDDIPGYLSSVWSESVIERLPSEVAVAIMSFLPARDMCRLGMTCRQLLACYKLELQRCASAYTALYGLPWNEDVLSFGKLIPSAALQAARQMREKINALFVGMVGLFDLNAFGNKFSVGTPESEVPVWTMTLFQEGAGMHFLFTLRWELDQHALAMWDALGFRSNGRVFPADLQQQLWPPSYQVTEDSSQQLHLSAELRQRRHLSAVFQPWHAYKLGSMLFTCAALVATQEDVVFSHMAFHG